MVKDTLAITDIDGLVDYVSHAESLDNVLFFLEDMFFEAIQHHRCFRQIKSHIMVLTRPGTVSTLPEETGQRPDSGAPGIPLPDPANHCPLPESAKPRERIAG